MANNPTLQVQWQVRVSQLPTEHHIVHYHAMSMCWEIVQEWQECV